MYGDKKSGCQESNLVLASGLMHVLLLLVGSPHNHDDH
jgi:hypothetical protein